MEFLKKVGERAESILEKVDSATEKVAKDFQDKDGRAVRATRVMLEKSAHEAAPEKIEEETDLEVMRAHVKRMQRELATANEVLASAQMQSAERVARLEGSLKAERTERDAREEEFLNRIATLEASDKRLREEAVANEALLAKLKEQSESAKDVETLYQEIERLKADKEQAQSLLAETTKQAAVRMSELERANQDLAAQLLASNRAVTGSEGAWGDLGTTASPRGGGDGEVAARGGLASPRSGSETPVTPSRLPMSTHQQHHQVEALRRELRAAEVLQQELADRAAEAENKRFASETMLTAERERANGLEKELAKTAATANELRLQLARLREELEAERAEWTRKLGKVGGGESGRKQREEANAGRPGEVEELRSTVVSLQQRLDALSSHLNSKQKLLDIVRGEKQALENRLQALAANPATSSSSSFSTTSPFSFYGEASSRASASLAAANNVKLISKIRLFSRHRGLARWLDAADGAAYNAVATLKLQPLARLGVYLYAVVVQAWFLAALFAGRGRSESASSSSSLRGA